MMEFYRNLPLAYLSPAASTRERSDQDWRTLHRAEVLRQYFFDFGGGGGGGGTFATQKGGSSVVRI